VAGRAAEERLVERGGEVLEVEHEDEGDEGQRERVRRQEGAPPPPVAVLRLPRSHRLGKQAEASSLPPCLLAAIHAPASSPPLFLHRKIRTQAMRWRSRPADLMLSMRDLGSGRREERRRAEQLLRACCCSAFPCASLGVQSLGGGDWFVVVGKVGEGGDWKAQLTSTSSAEAQAAEFGGKQTCFLEQPVQSLSFSGVQLFTLVRTVVVV
jgi:hypothetical protein